MADIISHPDCFHCEQPAAQGGEEISALRVRVGELRREIARLTSASRAELARPNSSQLRQLLRSRSELTRQLLEAQGRLMGAIRKNHILV
jgi:hypothetical protein